MSLRPNPPQGDPQQAAANPAISAAVSANAGSGKTKTLVDRVARLLLQGTRPETILCVTFTKAAASEMQRRLFQTLGTFAIARDEVLVEALSQLEGRPADTYDEGQLSAARRLFALALETPGGLKIQTLHGFCEKLLRQFPLEAGVTPGFTVLDDAAEAEVIRRARDQLAEAAADPATALGEAYARLSVKLDYAAFEALFANGVVLARPEQVRKIDSIGSTVHSVIERVAVMTAEGPRDAWVIATNTYHKTAQGWRLVAHHASPGSIEELQEGAAAPPVLH